MRHHLKLFSFALTLATSSAIALSAPILTGREIVLAQSTTMQNQKVEGDRAALEDAQRLVEQGNKQRNAKEFQAALESFHQALGTYQKNGDQRQEGQVLKNIGNVYFDMKDYIKALEHQQRALEIARATKYLDLEMQALNNIGLVYGKLEKSAKEIEYLQESLTIANNTQNLAIETEVIINLTNAYIRNKQPEKAIQLAETTLKLAQTKNKKEQEVLLLLTLAGTHVQLKDYKKGIYFATQAVELSRQINSAQQRLVGEIFLAALYIRTKQEDVAVNRLQNLFQSIEKDGIKPTEYEARKNAEFFTALICIQLDEFKVAIDLLERSLTVTQNPAERAANLPSLGMLILFYYALGENEKGNEFVKQALEISQLPESAKYQEAKGLIFIFMLYGALQQGEYQGVIDGAQELLRIGRANQNTDAELLSLYLLAESYGRLGNYSKARQFSQQSLDLSQSRKIPKDRKILSLLADILVKENRANEAISIYRKLLPDSGDLYSRVSLARVYQKLNLPSTAITFYKQAINMIEESRTSMQWLSTGLQESFLKKATFGYITQIKRVDVYRELADLLISQGRILEAQQVLELLKTQEVQDFTRSSSPEKDGNVLLSPREEQIKNKNDSLIAFGQKVDECEQSNCAQLKSLQDQRDKLVQEFDREVQVIEKEFRGRNIRNIDDAALAPKDFLGQAQEIVNAQPGTVLIYPLVMDNRIWLLWASRGGIVKRQEVKGVGQKQLGETVLKFRQLLQNPNSDLKELKATGKQLYSWLLQPIESELRENKIHNLVFSLDRSSRYIPMSALFDGEKYLIERYTVSTILSASYTDMSQRPPFAIQNTQVIAFGLSAAKPGFNALPNVPAELDAIVRQSQQDRAGIYLGQKFLNERFTADALRQNLRNYRVLHIATHGQFVPVNPDKSFLLLGDGNQLEIPRIRTLQNLRSIDLVVLSACETALGGADRDGVEIAGISSYFLRKGAAKAVMASLWLVNDASTSLSMQQFYKNLATGKMTKAEALQKVQLSFLRGEVTAKDATVRSDAIPQSASGNSPPATTANFSHPYYWAPFILIGNSL